MGIKGIEELFPDPKEPDEVAAEESVEQTDQNDDGLQQDS